MVYCHEIKCNLILPGRRLDAFLNKASVRYANYSYENDWLRDLFSW